MFGGGLGSGMGDMMSSSGFNIWENNLIALEYLYLKSKNDPKYIDLVFVRTKQYWTSKKNLKEMKKLQKYYGNYVVIDGWYKEITNIIRQNIVRLKNY